MAAAAATYHSYVAGYKRTSNPPQALTKATPWNPAPSAPPPSPPPTRPGRSSLSDLDSQHADAIRREAFASIYTAAPAAFSFSKSGHNKGEDDTGRKRNTLISHRRASIDAIQTEIRPSFQAVANKKTPKSSTSRAFVDGGDGGGAATVAEALETQESESSSKSNSGRPKLPPPMSSRTRIIRRSLQPQKRRYSVSEGELSHVPPPRPASLHVTNTDTITNTHTNTNNFLSYNNPQLQTRLLRVPVRFTARKTAVSMATTTQQYHQPGNYYPMASAPVQVGPQSFQSFPPVQPVQNAYSYAQAPTPRNQYPLVQPQQHQSTADFVRRTQRASARAMEQDNNPGANTVNPQTRVESTLPLLANKVTRPTLYSPEQVTPRRLSSSSNASNATAMTAMTSLTTRDSFESRRGRISNRSSFESAVSSPFDRSNPSTTRTTPMMSPMASPRWEGGAPGQYGPDMTAARFARMSWDPNQQSMRQAQGYPWQRPTRIKRRPIRKQGELFAALPGEVLELILEELKGLHLAPGSNSCATCWMRDATSVEVSSRKWSKFARAALYEDVQLIGGEATMWKKRYKLTDGARLTLLRRTLRSNPQIAPIVHSIKVPAKPSGMSTESYHNSVASVVMACPNLERLVGFYPSYDGSFSRLFQALSTRQRLKSMDWVVDKAPIPQIQQKSQRHSRSRSGSSANLASILTKRSTSNMYSAAALGEQPSLPTLNGSAFPEYHSNWTYLSSLSIHFLPGASLPAEALEPSTLSRLPALKHLYLSNLPSSICNDSTLANLPLLKTLSLSGLIGITSAGLSSFATHSAAKHLTKLTLRHMDLSSIPVLARILSNLPDLQILNVVQSLCPILPVDEVIWLYPYLASSTLHTLHWDITSNRPTGPATESDKILARSIASNGFPALRVLRTPGDGEGVFQALCRPRERIDLPTDRFRLPAAGASRPSTSSDGTPARPGTSSGRPSISSSISSGSLKKAAAGLSSSSSSATTAPSSPVESQRKSGSDLITARLAAQSRIEAGYKVPRFTFNVVDEDGTILEKFGLGGHVGLVGSKVIYHLLPDEGARDETGGLVEVADMLGHCGEECGSGIGIEGDGVAEGCTGKWNVGLGVADSKKERERWAHVERGRWRGVQLS